LTEEQIENNMRHQPRESGSLPMSCLVRDAAALVAIGAFIAMIAVISEGVWTVV
jgi:hypothetical protein